LVSLSLLAACDPVSSGDRAAVEQRLHFIEASARNLPPLGAASAIHLDGPKISVLALGDKTSEASGNAAFVHAEDLVDLSRFHQVRYPFGVTDELATYCAAILRGKRNFPERNTETGGVSEGYLEISRSQRKSYVALCEKLEYALIVRMGAETSAGRGYAVQRLALGDAPRSAGGATAQRVSGDVSVISMKTGEVLGTVVFDAEHGNVGELNGLGGQRTVDSTLRVDLSKNVEASASAALARAGVLAR
jgi:hypothetical protein